MKNEWFVLMAEEYVETEWQKKEIESYQSLILKAEQRRLGETNACYCRSCLRKVVEDANEAIDLLLELNPGTDEEKKLLWKYKYYLIPNGLRSSILNGEEYEEYRYKKYWKDKGQNKGFRQIF